MKSEPIWEHTVRGAVIGAILGVTFWLLRSAGEYLPMGVSREPSEVLTGFLLCVLAALWFSLCFPKRIAPVIAFIGAAVSASFAFRFGQLQFDNVMHSLLLVTKYQIGALLLGPFPLLFPAMILGYIVGRIHSGAAERTSFFVSSQDGTFARGVVIPAIGFLIVIYLYGYLLSLVYHLFPLPGFRW